MANFCLIPAEADKFIAKLRSGEIDPYKLNKMSSEDRHKFFAGIVGEDNATGVNGLFESKILLKNQKYAYTAWAKNVAGITPATRRDLISRIERLDKVLNPGEEKAFLKDLAETRLGVAVTYDEAQKIAAMSKKVRQAKEVMDNGGDHLAYGRAKVALGNHVNSLKEQAGKQTLSEQVGHPVEAVSKTAGLAKSLKASLDNSAIFRQGWKTLWTDPVQWQRNARKTFTDMAKELKGKDVMDEVTADIISRPNYDRMKKAKLAVADIPEEAYPSSAPGKLPVLGRVYKASQSAYEGFVHRQRADVFDKYLDIAKKTGVNIDDKVQLEAIGKLVNSLTGRGNLGSLEKSANTINNVFFSPRFLKSNIDTLTAHQFQKNVTPFVRKKAAENLVKVILGTTAILAIADALHPGSVEKDPRSSDFGKIKIGNTRFDVTGGMGSIPTLVARLLPSSGPQGKGQYTKGAGGLKKLNSGYGSQTGMDVVNNFIENKFSPAASVVKDLVKQQDFNGNKPTVGGELKNLFVPLPISNVQELRSDPNSANTLVSEMADAFGISVNTYGKSTKNWSTNPTNAQQEFKSKVSPEKFKAANDAYNKRVDMFQRDHAKKLASLPPGDTTLSEAKKKIQETVMKQYGYTYKTKKSDKGALKQRKELLNSIR